MTDTEPIGPTDGHPDGSAWFELVAQVGSLSTSVRQMHEAQQRAAPVVPLLSTVPASGVVPASGPLMLDLGAPAMGRRWTVKRLSVSASADVTAAVVGRADWYVGTFPFPNGSSWEWPQTALPGVQRFGSDELVVMPTSRLFVAISGGTAGQSLTARALVQDYPATAGSTVITV